MENKIRLTEDELRQIIRESVHSQLINEANPFKNWWNKLSNRFNNHNNDDEDEEEKYQPIHFNDDEDEEADNDNEDEEAIDLNGGDDNNIIIGGSNHEEPDEVEIPQGDEEQPQDENPERFNAGEGGQPFYYGGETGDPARVNLQGNEQPQGEETPENNGSEADAQPAGVANAAAGNGVNGEGGADEGTNENGGENAAEENSNGVGNGNANGGEEQQPQQPAYQRGQKYNMTFSQQNEEVIKDYINPAYDSITKAYKALYSLIQLGPDKYNHVALLQGKQNEYMDMKNKVNQIWPIMRDIRSKMKTILYANGIRNTEDYQHYGIEEQKLRKLVSNSIQKVLSECLEK